MIERAFTFTAGVSETQSTWTDRRSATWQELAALLTKHERGPKEGACIVPATFRGTRRAAAEAERIDLVMLDADCGHTLDEIEEAIKAHGWAAIVHSTHSHLAASTRAKVSHWQKFHDACPIDAERVFLIEEKGYLPRVAAGATLDAVDDTYAVFEHAPCPKFRIILRLARPWQAADYPSQAVANAAWKERIEALAAALKLSHDQSCTDTSRLFYLPRYQGDGREPVAAVIDGTDCDIWRLPCSTKSEQPGGMFGAQRSTTDDAGEFTDPETGECFNLRQWARDFGRQFEIVTALQARKPGAFVGHVTDGAQHHIRCVNEDAHTNAGADRATIVVNASAARKKGFAYHCRHAHCTSHDRLFFLRRMLAQGWLKVDDLTDPEFLTKTESRDQDQTADTSDNAPPSLLDPWDSLQPPPFHIDALPAVLRAFVEDRSHVIGADPCALGWAAISACSAAIDGRVRLQMKSRDAWTVPPFVWLALVGAPSTKKTPILDAAWEPLQRAQGIDLQLWRADHARWAALPKKERAETPEPQPRRRLVSHDATIESLQDILARQDRGIGLLRDELAGWVGSLEKYTSGRGSAADRAFFLQAFNGGPYVVDRVSRGTVPIENLGLAIAGGIQPDRLRQMGDLTSDGLWQRFAPIIVGAPSLGSDGGDSQATSDYAAMVDRLLHIDPKARVQLSEPAQAVRRDVAERLFEIEQSEALGAAFSAFCGKLHGLWGRLCLVLSQIDPDPVSFIVPERIALAATTLLFKCVLPHAARVYASMGGAGGNIEATRSVAGYILTKRKDRVLASDLAHNVRACRGQPLEDVRRVVSPLVAGGWLAPEHEFNPTAWTVHPHVHQRFAARAEQEEVRRAAVRALIVTGRGADDAEAE